MNWSRQGLPFVSDAESDGKPYLNRHTVSEGDEDVASVTDEAAGEPGQAQEMAAAAARGREEDDDDARSFLEEWEPPEEELIPAHLTAGWDYPHIDCVVRVTD